MDKATSDQPKDTTAATQETPAVGFLDVARSTFSAFLGVQSDANRERDFTGGKMSHFIWMGLIFGVLFVLSIIGVVQLVLHFTGN